MVFLSENGYLWAIGKDEDLKSQIVGNLKYLSHYYFTQKKFEEAITVLKVIVNLVPYEEDGNNLLIKSFAAINDGASIIIYYHHLEQLLKNDYDMLPAVSTRQLYEKLTKEIYR